MSSGSLSRRTLLGAAAGLIGCGGAAAHEPTPAETPAKPVAKPEPIAEVIRWSGAAGRYQDELARAKGLEVALTLRANLQRATEAALNETASAGAAVLVEVKTGRIIALHEVAGRNSHPLVAAYAPGSLFKPFVAYAALHANKASDEITCRGLFDHDGLTYRCTRKHGPVTLERAIAESCNVYFFEMGLRVGAEALRRHAHAFGFEQSPLPTICGDRGMLLPAGRRVDGSFNGHQVMNVSIGQGFVKATPLQLAHAYLRVINADPRAALALTASTRRDPAPELDRRLFVRIPLGLTEAVTSGTATAFDAGPLSAAGKTGTAQVHVRRDARGRLPSDKELRDDSWFAGYAPADAPRMLTVVLLENSGAGGKYAARLASKLMRAATSA